MERKKNTEQTRKEAQKYVINNLRWKLHIWSVIILCSLDFMLFPFIGFNKYFRMNMFPIWRQSTWHLFQLDKKWLWFVEYLTFSAHAIWQWFMRLIGFDAMIEWHHCYCQITRFSLTSPNRAHFRLKNNQFELSARPYVSMAK